MTCSAGSRSRPGLFGIEALDQLGRALEVGKEHRHLLALAFQGGFGREDFLGEVRRGVRLECLGSRCERWGCGGRGGQRGATMVAEGRAGWGFAATRGALPGYGAPAGRTKAGALTVLMLTVRAVHGSPFCARLST